jgi:hypothetical protein
VKVYDVKKLKKVGKGAFAEVYFLSETRVVKVFSGWNKRYAKGLIKDEIKGSKCVDCTPVIRKVKVIDETGQENIGLVKKYIPHRCTYEEMRNFKYKYPDYMDVHIENVRKDDNGKIWMIDTQSCSY